MAIQYYMRAFNTTLSSYVDWVVNDTPDSIGAFSGYPANQLINITVNRIVQSKVANFLKPNQSRGGTDGYFFHVNSYDWINATAPQTGVPLTFTGFAVERGVNSVAAISNASNTSPINVTTSTPHGLVTGQNVTIIGVTGNINANGTWPITVLGNFNFTLNGSTSSGAPNNNTGNVFLPKDMSTLIWDEVNQLWRFVINSNGDGTTLGASQSVKVNNFFIDGYQALGSPTASQGIIRLPNNQYIFARQSSNLGDVQLIGADTFTTPTGSNRIKLGGLSTDVVYTPGIIDVDGYVQHDGSLGSVAQSGFIREQNNTNIVVFRAQNLLSDVVALSSNTLNNVILGDATNGGLIFNTATGNVSQFQVNSAPQFEIGTAFARFTQAVPLPTILQTAAAINSNGQTLTLQAQNAAATGTGTGGNLNLTSGAGNASPTANGIVNLQTGGTTRITLNDTTETYNIPLVTFAAGVVAPVINQTTTAATPAQPLTLQAQNSTNVAGVGGQLNLVGGLGSTAQNDGYVVLATGGTAPSNWQLIASAFNYPAKSFPVSTGKVTILGNLEVQGTLTTVDSTTVDIVGAVIHGNWSDPASSPNVGIPITVVGYSSHRGNIGGVPRDGASLIWTEGTTATNSGFGVSVTGPLFASDGYWRAVSTVGDGFGVDTQTIANSPASVGVLANNFVASIDPNPPILTIPGTPGSGLRTPNNVTSVVARNTNSTTTIAAASNLATLPQGTINVASTTGFTTAGSLLIATGGGNFTTVTYTGGGGGGTTFTGAAGGSGTLLSGAAVSQAVANTSIAAGSNNVQLPTGTITVASTVGFPTSGTLRILTYGGPGTPGTPGNGGGVQYVNYTNTSGGTQFTGCTGGTGFMYTGDPVQLAGIAGSADLILLGTDFGNHILHGFQDGYSTFNTGQIFNTNPPAVNNGFVPGNFYDFWLNGVSQIQLGDNDFDTDGYAETITVGPTIGATRFFQATQLNTGTNAGSNMMLQAQAGQQQTGGANNNNGGILTLASGAAGTGGGGTAGVAGVVTINVGSINNSTFNNIDPDADGYAEWLAAGPTIVNPRLYQATLPGTGTNAGTNFKINAQAGQNVAGGTNNNGGNLVLASGTPGTGGTAGTPGQIEFFYGGTLELTLTDGSLQWSNLITNAPTISQAGGVTTGQTMTIQAQNASATGGALTLTSGSGSTNGNVNIQTGGGTRVLVTTSFTAFNDSTATEALRITPVSNGTTQITYAATDTAAQINQTQTASTPSAPMSIQSQVTTATSGVGGTLTLTAGNATGTTSTGGALNLASGSGTTTNGVINFQPGGTTQILITATGQQIQWVNTVTAPTLKQNDNTAASGTGQPLTIQAQNATGTTSTGGNAVITSGTGTTVAGNVLLETGGTPRVTVTPTNTQFADTATALTITPVSAGTTQITFAATDTAAQINQTQTASTPSAPMTIQSQVTTATSGVGGNLSVTAGNATGTTSTGGNLNLSSGSGTSTNGTLNLEAGGTVVASVVTNKFVNNQGHRRHVTAVTGTYQVLATDDYLAITTISAPFTITLPSAPTTGDEYWVKDTTGTAATNNVTISGNGNNIDGSATITLSQNYAAVIITFTGSQWSLE